MQFLSGVDTKPGNRGGLHYSQSQRYLATRASQIQLLAFRPRRENRRPLSPIREVGLGRSPDTATAEDLRAFQLHLTATGVQPPTVNATVTVLRFLFKVTLDRPETTRHLVFVYEPRKLPRVLSPEEVLRLLEAAPVPSTRRRSALPTGPVCGPWRLSR
jgi:hypothetical protein